MPCVYVETCYLKDILAALPELPSCNWLITDLECYDYHGWDGCEKWAETELFLTDAELRRDVNLRNMQFLWGVFSAIPTEYSREEVYSHPLPESQIPMYMNNHIVPQHPLAVLEFYVDDGWFTFVSTHDEKLLHPLYKLPYPTKNEEADNQVMNAQLRQIQIVLRNEIPDVSPEIANEVQWIVWHRLFNQQPTCVSNDVLRREVAKEYHVQIQTERKHWTTFWDPFTQE